MILKHSIQAACSWSLRGYSQKGPTVWTEVLLFDWITAKEANQRPGEEANQQTDPGTFIRPVLNGKGSPFESTVRASALSWVLRPNHSSWTLKPLLRLGLSWRCLVLLWLLRGLLNNHLDFHFLVWVFCNKCYFLGWWFDVVWVGHVSLSFEIILSILIRFYFQRSRFIFFWPIEERFLS